MPTVLSVEFRVVTPLFLGGADPNQPELRTASIKASLRYWYRAIDPRATFAKGGREPRREERIFGGTTEPAGQAPVLLRVRSRPWNNVNLKERLEGRDKKVPHGVKYLTYPFFMKGNDERCAIPPGTTFTLDLVVPPQSQKRVDEDTRRAYVAALWLLGTLGSLGSRNRRGLGSLEVTNWSAAAEASHWNEVRELPDLRGVSGANAWNSKFGVAMQVFDSWFDPFEASRFEGVSFEYPHLGRDMNMVVLRDRYSGWLEALDRAGRCLQVFRLRKSPDYQNVKTALAVPTRLSAAPERAVFGLPLAFRYSSLPREAGTAEFVPRLKGEELDRHASLLRIRLVRVGDRLHPLFLRMSGAIPGMNPRAGLVRRKPDKPPKTEDGVLDCPQGHLLDEFMRELGEGKL